MTTPEITALAQQLVDELAARRLHIATAESLTAGAVAATIADIPGASAVLNGGVVSYTNQVKHTVLGVDHQLLDTRGAVVAQTAKEMASGTRTLCHADLGISTTGVAGPEPHAGKSVGTVFIGLSTSTNTLSREFHFQGDRPTIRAASVEAALSLVLEHLNSDS